MLKWQNMIQKLHIQKGTLASIETEVLCGWAELLRIEASLKYLVGDMEVLRSLSGAQFVIELTRAMTEINGILCDGFSAERELRYLNNMYDAIVDLQPQSNVNLVQVESYFTHVSDMADCVLRKAGSWGNVIAIDESTARSFLIAMLNVLLDLREDGLSEANKNELESVCYSLNVSLAAYRGEVYEEPLSVIEQPAEREAPEVTEEETGEWFSELGGDDIQPVTTSDINQNSKNEAFSQKIDSPDELEEIQSKVDGLTEQQSALSKQRPETPQTDKKYGLVLWGGILLVGSVFFWFIPTMLLGGFLMLLSFGFGGLVFEREKKMILAHEKKLDSVVADLEYWQKQKNQLQLSEYFNKKQHLKTGQFERYKIARKEIEAMPRYQTWRQEVLQKHGKQCAICSTRQNVEVDHYPHSMYSLVKSAGILDLPSSEQRLIRAYEFTPLWDVNNGAPLCREHHRQTTSSQTYHRLNNT
jgi:hypothetical protein